MEIYLTNGRLGITTKGKPDCALWTMTKHTIFVHSIDYCIVGHAH